LFAATSIALSLLAAAALIEIVIRVLGLGTSLVYVPHPLYGWAHRAEHSFSWVTEGRAEPITINSLRLREHEITYARQAGRARVLALGDSFVEALQVPLTRSFTKQLETLLDSAGHPTEVINAGVSGYGTDNELLYWRAEGHKFQPDVVLLCLYVGNDVRNNFHALELLDSGAARKPHFSLERGQLKLHDYPFPHDQRLAARVKLTLNLHWRTYAFMRELRDRQRHAEKEADDAAPLDFGVFARQPGAQWERAWQLTSALLAEFRRSAESSGSRLFVVLVPTRFQVYPDRFREFLSSRGLDGAQWDLEAPNRRLSKILQLHRIDFVDLLPGLRVQARRNPAPLYFGVDEHWTEAGHQAAAALTAPELREPGSTEGALP
jgi:hypothetical protein